MVAADGEPLEPLFHRMASSRRKRPCGKCRRWFEPDARVGDRQRVCSREECQRARQQCNELDWQRRHPGYFIAWRAKERASRSPPDDPDPPRVPAPLTRLPWVVAQEEFGSTGADFLGSFGRLLVIHAKKEMRTEVTGFKGETGKVPPDDAKKQMGA